MKSLALLARLLFFVLVIPILVSGELAIYMYINSVALVIAIVAILGLNDELPRVVCGDANKARSYFNWSIWLNIAAMLALVTMWIQPSIVLGIVLFAATLMASRFLGGIIRSVDPAVYERLQNVPWVLFIIIAVALRLDNAFDLLIARCATMILVIWHSLYVINRAGDRRSKAIPVGFTSLAGRALNHGISKLVSNLFILGVIRGPIMLPVWLGVSADLDSIAFAVAVGEVIVQFGLIPANRAYAAWCRKSPTRVSDWHHAISLSLLLAVALAAASFLLLVIGDILQILPRQVASVPVLAQALLLYALISAFYSLRYLLWARGILEYLTVLLPACMFALTVIAIGLADSSVWFAWLSVGAAAGIAVLALVSRKYFLNDSAVIRQR